MTKRKRHLHTMNLSGKNGMPSVSYGPFCGASRPALPADIFRKHHSFNPQSVCKTCAKSIGL